MAASNGHTECFNLLWEEHKKNNSIDVTIVIAVSEDPEEFVKMMIATGFDVNQEFKEEYRSLTPLMMPILDSVGSVQLLIEAGANVNYKNRNGLTPLLWHAYSGRLKCVKALIEAGADVNAANNRRKTALMFSVSRNDNKIGLIIVQALLNKGANINILHDSGRNAFSFLAMCKIDQHKFQEKLMILFAAGEKLDKQALEAVGQKVPDHLQPQLNLKEICRRRIREHLLRLDPHTHLFSRIPRLELPSLLTSYLLYGVALNDDDENVDDDIDHRSCIGSDDDNYSICDDDDFDDDYDDDDFDDDDEFDFDDDDDDNEDDDYYT